MPYRRVWLSLLVALALCQLPPTAPAAPLAQTCSPRPQIGVTTTLQSDGRLLVSVSVQPTSTTPPNALTALRFGEPRAMENALVELGDQPAQGGRVTLDLAPGTTQTSFYIRAISRSQPVTVHFVAVDRCGDWPTFVGHGPGVTQAAVVTATPPGAATATPTATFTATATGTRTATPSLGASTATPTRTPTAWPSATATSAPKIPAVGANPAALLAGEGLT